jgi:hypothetical protein
VATVSSPPRALPPPRLCRQFWKSGDYVVACRNPDAAGPGRLGALALARCPRRGRAREAAGGVQEGARARGRRGARGDAHPRVRPAQRRGPERRAAGPRRRAQADNRRAHTLGLARRRAARGITGCLNRRRRIQRNNCDVLFRVGDIIGF